MTVQELRDALAEFPAESPVRVFGTIMPRVLDRDIDAVQTFSSRDEVYIIAKTR